MTPGHPGRCTPPADTRFPPPETELARGSSGCRKHRMPGWKEGSQKFPEAQQTLHPHKERRFPRRHSSLTDVPATAHRTPSPEKAQGAAGVSHPLNLPCLKTCQSCRGAGVGTAESSSAAFHKGLHPEGLPLPPFTTTAPTSPRQRQSPGAHNTLSPTPQIHELTNLLHPPIPGQHSATLGWSPKHLPNPPQP